MTATYSSGISSSLASSVAGLTVNGTSVSSLLSQYLGSTQTTIPQIQYEDLGITLKLTPVSYTHLDVYKRQEYTETSQRHAFLEAQRRDLIESIENTQASIKEIDDVSRIKFDEAFKAINQNFSATFSKLFGGGQAFMRLTDPEGLSSDQSGIDIIASPPGRCV